MKRRKIKNIPKAIDKKNFQQIEQKVIEVLSRILNIKPEKIKPESRLVEDLGMDSFNAIEIAFEIEEAFRIKISQDKLQRIKKVADLLKEIKNVIK